ncbi:ribonuclease T1 [Fomes fomentarius]|nr:ribonuclease T1 [Fomes fomentarius]
MKLSAVLVLVAVLVTSGTVARVARRQSGACECAGRTYTSNDVSNAIGEAEDGGAGEYPHQYHDYEGFSFPLCSGEFFEYPLKHNGIYTGGSPGADRVIYDTDGDFCG